LDLLSERLTDGPNWRSHPHRNVKKMPRPEHWLDDALAACIEQEGPLVPHEVRRIFIDLCGSIRSLERQLNLQDERLKVMYARLELFDPKLANEYFRPDVVSLSNDGVLVRDEVA
jgi:hypothetical protein